MKTATLLVSLVLAGCCSGVATDPRQGGYVGGVCGKATGAYEARLVARRSELARLDAAGAALEARLGAERREAAGLEARLRSSRETLAADRRQLDALAAEIDREAAAGRLDRQRLDALKAEFAGLDRQLAGLLSRAAETARIARALREGVAVAQTERQLDAAAAELSRDGAAASDRLQAFRRKLRSGN